MKALLAFVLIASGLCADEARYETTTTTSGTNDIAISEFETGQIVYLDNFKDGIKYTVEKGGQTLWNISGSPTEGTIIRGPAIFRTVATPPNTPPPWNYSCMTVKITPEAFSPNKTVILPPGTNQVQVVMETSTNLVSWEVTTNGIYESPDTARFFRIRMAALAP